MRIDIHQAQPDCALLAIKWHRRGTRASWHWVVFVRARGQRYVQDGKRTLKSHVRRDFRRMKPKWSLTVATRR